MQLEKTKLAKQIGIAFLGANIAFFAAADSFTATVTTIDDVNITERVALDFGTNIFTVASETCTMNAATPGNVLMNLTHDTGVTQANYGDLTGNACVNGAGLGTPGVYDITGAVGGTVKILISEVAQVGGDFTYAPSGGCYGDYNGTTVTDGDVCTSLPVGTVVDTDLADAALSENDTVGLGGATAVEGGLSFTLGGVISTGATGLTAETPYVLAFQVDVTY